MRPSAAGRTYAKRRPPLQLPPGRRPNGAAPGLARAVHEPGAGTIRPRLDRDHEPEKRAHDAPNETRHRLHPERTGGRGPRPPVHGAGRPGRSVPAGARPADASSSRWSPRTRAAPSTWPTAMPAPAARFGAALGIGGPGCCNMATAVAAAKTDASPVLVMTGEVPVDMEGRGAFQDASQATLDDTAVMAPLTRLSKTVAEQQEPESLVPPRADHHVGAAARPGPSLADARRADRRMRGGVRQGRRLLRRRSAAEPRAGALRRSTCSAARERRQIAILAGAGVEHDAAAARLKEIAERWSIPVATTLRAKGVFPEDHELSLGVFGYAGTRHATAAILDGELDCLLVLGSGFNERDTMHWTVRERSKALMIHVNTDMDELTAHGDLGHVVPGELPRLPRPDARARRPHRAGAARPAQARRRDWLAQIKAGPRLYDVENMQPTEQPDPSGHRDRGAAQGVPARRHRARRFRRAPRLRRALLERLRAAHLHLGHQSRADGLGDPGGRRRAVRAARTGASPSSPATAACRCTASRCRPRRATGCRSSTSCSTTARSAMSGCARASTARCRRS